jgi:Fe2+ or Zn2+ uptake regulation protein
VVDFSGYDLSELEQRLSLETGFKIEGHLLEFIGLCQNCQKETT